MKINCVEIRKKNGEGEIPPRSTETKETATAKV
jgi:hypothetical protein